MALILGCSMLAGGAVPVVGRTPLPKPVPPAVNDSPVRCNTRSQAEYPTGMYRSAPVGASRGIMHGNIASPPPPPPPPPPVVGMPSPKIAADASRAQVAEVKAHPGRVMPPQYMPPPPESRDRYAGEAVASIMAVAEQPVSTFSVDVDTASYANVRRFLSDGQLPPAGAVRTEEMVNYFRYDYETPADRSRPFALSADMSRTPWNADTRLLRIGINGYDLAKDKRPPANLVFLVDVSGSMFSQDKLPLVKSSLAMLADRLSPQDRVSIVVYAGAAGIVLEPTSQPHYIKAALDCLQAGGSTAGGQGMELAYATARAHFIKGGVNRVIMATDGDFNVGISSQDGIEAIVKKNRESGITLTTLGFGRGNLNDAMMEKVADIGNGNYAYIDSAIEAQKVLDEEMAATLFTIAKDVKIQIEFNPAQVKEYRLIGYENRILAEEDFNNDKVDAGDIGAGHQVTALYEIVPAFGRGWLPERRYEANRAAVKPSGPDSEMAWLKLRYKLPDGDKSMLIERPVPASWISSAAAPRGDTAFAASVAAFGQKLRGDKYLGGYGWADIRALAGEQRGYLREEYLKLVGLAAAQSREAQ
jgi:Ca-activated chloride channel family protein